MCVIASTHVSMIPASRKNSQCFTCSIFFHVTALFQNGLNYFFTSKLYIQYTIIQKKKNVWHSCKFSKSEKQKYDLFCKPLPWPDSTDCLSNISTTWSDTIPTMKHGGSTMLWGSFSAAGMERLVGVNGKMNAAISRDILTYKLFWGALDLRCWCKGSLWQHPQSRLKSLCWLSLCCCVKLWCVCRVVSWLCEQQSW